MDVAESFVNAIQLRPQGFIMDGEGHIKEFHEGFAVGSGVPMGCVEEAISQMGPNQYLGYWVGQNGTSYIDITDIYTGLATAMLAGLARGEQAIYDFANCTVLELNNQEADFNA